MRNQGNSEAKYIQIRYVIAGIWNTVFGILIFGLMLILLEDKIGYIFVLFLTAPVTIFQAHFVQRKYVWSSTSLYGLELRKFGSVYIGQFILNSLLLTLLVEHLHIGTLKAQILITPPLVLVAYLLNRSWIFRRSLG